MGKRKKKKERYFLRGLVFILWLFLQLGNSLITLAVFDAYGNSYYVKNSVAIPIFTALIVYLLLRNFNYGVCRVLGYHAAADLNEMTPFIGLDSQLHSGFIFPTFVKTTNEYRVIYKTRSKFFQYLFYLLFVIIVAGTAGLLLYAEFLIFNKKIPNSGLIIVATSIILTLILYLVSRSYYVIFPQIFHLKVILREHGHPVYGRSKIPKHKK
ncbi:hypothetical protein OXT66_07310 [Lentilactobacillus senioris]|uniref:hypothetical protein n=1 Tax=Lentilactobacillus senioris TaxID=931534 RepID=UPI00227F125F|nr:hypothetical protein [Lentilactobacillus senioris]MCY9807340.1 hypothetical protein [Lentilactobacillus senioris]